jgi:hypothetical protein
MADRELGKQFRKANFWHTGSQKLVMAESGFGTADLKIQLWRQKHWVVGICQMRENGIQLFFQAPNHV